MVLLILFYAGLKCVCCYQFARNYVHNYKKCAVETLANLYSPAVTHIHSGVGVSLKTYYLLHLYMPPNMYTISMYPGPQPPPHVRVGILPVCASQTYYFSGCTNFNLSLPLCVQLDAQVSSYSLSEYSTKNH